MPTDTELRDAIRTTLRGFDESVFIGDPMRSLKPGWIAELLPFLQALDVLKKYVDAEKT